MTTHHVLEIISKSRFYCTIKFTSCSFGTIIHHWISRKPPPSLVWGGWQQKIWEGGGGLPEKLLSKIINLLKSPSQVVPDGQIFVRRVLGTLLMQRKHNSHLSVLQ